MAMKMRLDQKVMQLGLVQSRSQAESYIKLGDVTVNGKVVTKPGQAVGDTALIEINRAEQYVSRAALKLASVADLLSLDFQDKVVLDVGSSTGGFTDYALKHGASKVIAVEVGTNQLHPTLHNHPKIELYEQTDIRSLTKLDPKPDIVVIDVSFISLREILPHIAELSSKQTQIVAMVKPQFEAGKSEDNQTLKHKGVIKNDKMRRDILKSFEVWTHSRFITLDKADSAISGAKGNQERFYLLRKA